MRQTRRRGWNALTALSVLGGMLGIAGPAKALAPDEVAVLYNTRSPISLQVARYYINARKIPLNHLIVIDCEASENITEELYRTSIVPQINKAFADGKMNGSVKCLVTTYDVPLRIHARQMTAAEKQEMEADQKQFNDLLATLEKCAAQYDAILPLPAPPPPIAPGPASTQKAATAPASSEPRTLLSVMAKLNMSSAGAGRRVERATEPARTQAASEFIRLQERIAGATGLLNTLHVPEGSPNAEAARRQLALISDQVRDFETQYQGLIRQEDHPEARRQMLELRLKSRGLFGQAQTLEEIIAYLQPESTESCFDSELAYVLSDQSYPRGKWLMNPLNLEIYQSTPHAPRQPSLMVTRLDGLTPAKIEEMIDTGLQVEAKGLEGTLYLDARGMHGADAYGVYDADLRRAADWLKQHSSIEVVLDDTPDLLRAKDAPNAALYCGWYSLNQYQDSGQWVKGAVGYHVASFEMTTLHNPRESGWVPNLLNRGFCGTLGATDEPYLIAFPKSSLFFPLLLSGEFTQGEVWQVTNPTLSWRIGYVGDPLYNPYKNHPKVKIEDLKANTVLRNAFLILRGETPGPASRPE